MNRFTHARYARLLIEACGLGVEELAKHVRVSKTLLSEYQNPHGQTYMPADVIADLEAFCGKPIYSRALFEAQPEVAPIHDLVEEVCEAAEAVTELQRKVRLAAKDGHLTPRTREELARDCVKAESELREVGQIIAFNR